MKKNIYRAWRFRLNNLFLFKVEESELNEFKSEKIEKEFYLLYPIQTWKLYFKSEKELKTMRKKVLENFLNKRNNRKEN